MVCQLVQFKRNGLTRFMHSAWQRKLPFFSSNGALGAKITRSGPKKRMGASTAGGPGTKCQEFRSFRVRTFRLAVWRRDLVEKPFEWVSGAKLLAHSKRKHKILREYVYDYLNVRCALPQQERFRLAVVDGFAGGGRYECGTSGSPLIFIEELKRASEAVNRLRVSRGLREVEVECFLVFNDANHAAVDQLKRHATPLLAGIEQTCSKLHLHVEYLNDLFEVAYPKIRSFLERGRYRNVLFNLDQCGDKHVARRTIVEIMHSYPSVEIFYTFAIESLLAFLQKRQPEQLRKRLGYLGLTGSDIQRLDPDLISTNEWLGKAEMIVFDAFHLCAQYVSPFSINNPGGWRYWLIHFANSYRARQVYNNILHENASLQAHFGRSGLDMLHYDPRHDEGLLYLFDDDARLSSRKQLLEDIPRVVEESGDAMSAMNFYGSIYNATPAHADDIHTSIIDHPDVEVITPAGGERRKANTIGVNDVIKLKKQRSFFPFFLKAETLEKKK